MTVSKNSQKSVTYILGPTQFRQGHSLGVTALEFSKPDNKLFSAGRDGIVSSWTPQQSFGEVDYPLDELDRFLNSYSSIHDYASSSFDNESEILTLESQIRKGINFNLPKFGDYEMMNHAQIHSDWINDIKLLNDNRSIVTCSSDLSIKIWDSSTNDLVTAIGYHTDYVRCLAYHKLKPGIIISGSLDKSIAIWDLEKKLQIASIKDSDNERGSIYALSSLPNVLASGGPENVIKLYDTRSNNLKPLVKFLGHQGNIKTLNLKNKLMLSGSADSTLKLWCLRTNRVLRTFDMHESSIWSLECPEEENGSDDFFNVFYSGDRNGLIIKTDLKSCNYDYYFSNNSIITGKLNENLGISTVIADLSDSLISDSPDFSEKGSIGVLSLKFGDNSIWSSSSSVMSNSSPENSNAFIRRWAVPSTNKLVTYQAIKLLRNLAVYNKDSNGPIDNTNNVDSSLVSMVSDPFEASNIVNDDLYDLVSQLSNNSTYDLLDDPSATKPISQLDLQADEDVSLLSPFLSTFGGPSQEFIINNDLDSDVESGDAERIVILHTLVSPKAIRTIPIAVDPLQTIQGQNGLVKHRLLNNRRHVVTMDTSGKIEIWDLIKGCSLETIDSTTSELNNFHSGADLLEYQFDEAIDKRQTNETLPMWCKVEIKSGKLFVTLQESTFSNTEIYLDQLFSDFPLLEKQYSTKYLEEELEEKRISSRVNLGRMVLKNIFRNFIKVEILRDRQYRNPKSAATDLDLTTAQSISTLDLNFRGTSSDKSEHETFESITSNDPAKLEAPLSIPLLPSLTKKASNDDHKRKFKFFGKSSRSGSTSSTVENSKTGHPSNNATHEASKETQHIGEDSTFALIKEIRAKYNTSNKGVVDSSLDIGELELPFVELPKDMNTLIIVNEVSNNSAHELFHGPLANLSYSSLEIIEKALPRWCGNALLLSKFPVASHSKINFVIEELIDPKTKSTLAPITQLSNKLNAASVLRAHKIAAFIIERLDEKPQEVNKPGFRAYEFLELSCMGQVIPFDMTLATMKARIWKKSGDVVINYRRKQQ